jgi:hypothetical protein
MLSRFATLGGAPTDPYWANVSYLLVGNGANGTTTNIKDSSSNNLAVTIFGNTVISTTQSKYGSGSVYFDGSGDYINIAGSSATNLTGVNFTIECWLYAITIGTTVAYKIFNWDSPNDYLLEVTRLSNTTFSLGVYCGGVYIVSSSSSPANCNQWNYITFVRNGNTGIFFINGVLINSVAFAPTSTGSNSGTSIGMGNNYPGSYYLNGYIYDLRITKGVARYTASFTPPTGPLPTTGP